MDIENVKRNIKLLIDGVPYNIVEAEFVKPGKGRAIYRLKLKNLFDGSVLERTYHSGERVDEAPISAREEQFLYKEGDRYTFMATDTFEQNFLSEEQLGEKRLFLKEGALISVVLLNDKPIDISIPTFVELKVVRSEISSRSDTITAQIKPAVMETGARVDVPTFIKEGDIVKVDTRTGGYVERVTVKK